MTTFEIFTSICAAAGLWALLSIRSHLAQTTLITAWWLAMLAAVCGLIAWIELAVSGPFTDPQRQQLWYTAAVLGCCPWIAVLGARRPTSNVWVWFVVVPLVLVLEWPAIAQMMRHARTLDLQWPALVGFLLVLIMGFGNYFATRFTFAAVLLATAIGFILWNQTSMKADAAPESSRLAWSVILTSAGILMLRRSLNLPDPRLGPDRIWDDFRDLFGIVWAKRVMERVNHSAEIEGWRCRLQIDRVDWLDDSTGVQTAKLSRDETSDKLLKNLRWLLKRFVDDEWLLHRLEDHQKLSTGTSPQAEDMPDGHGKDSE